MILTDKNAYNWVKFLGIIIDDKYAVDKINRFLKPYYHREYRYANHLVYKKYCK